MADWTGAPAAEQRRIAEAWLAEFGAALSRQDSARMASLIHADGYWRDLLTFGWDFRTLHGVDEITAWLRDAAAVASASDFRLEGEPAVGVILDHQTLEFFFTFATALAHGRGHARLVADPPAAATAAAFTAKAFTAKAVTAKAFTVLTTMKELKDFPQATARNRPREDWHLATTETANWLDRRNAARQIGDRDPDVVVIGGGQSGLMLAARLGQLKVSTLVVEKTPRVGDVWRNRYRSLKLHNETCMNHFAYLPFPDTWPAFIPKDKLADWLEFYAEAMELNVWTGATFLSGAYDETAGRWTVRLQRADGSIQTLQPAHVVMAAGVSGLPSIPEFAGREVFGGPIIHSSGNTDALDVAGKAVLVVGAGTSAHDIAQDLYARGAAVTMLQRSSITVVSLEPSSVRPYELYRRNDGIRPIADTDLVAASVPYPLLARLHGPLSRQMADDDKELLDGLRKVGFLLDNGEDDTGYFLKLLRYQAGYYLNIGASDLIVAGKIKLKAGVDIARLQPRCVIFADGSTLDADAIVLATGYQPLQEAVRAIFGDAVAERVGPIWGLANDGELRAMYARTGQEGFYVAGGGLPGARAYSHYTALLIKAALQGLLPPRPPAVAKSTAPQAEPGLAGVPAL